MNLDRIFLVLTFSLVSISALAEPKLGPESILIYESLLTRYEPVVTQQGGAKRQPLEQVSLLQNSVVLAVPLAPSTYPLMPMNKEMLKHFSFDESAQFKAADFGSVPVRLLSASENRQIFSQSCTASWDVFHKKFPSTKYVVELSHIGFRDNGLKAIVMVKQSSGCHGENVWLFTFEKRGGRWLSFRRDDVSPPPISIKPMR